MKRGHVPDLCYWETGCAAGGGLRIQDGGEKSVPAYGKVPDTKRLAKLGERWRPYRSIATWYLWRSLEPKYQEE